MNPPHRLTANHMQVKAVAVRFAKLIALGVFVYFAHRLVLNSWLYSNFATDVGFFRYKNPQLLENKIWLYAFFIHALLSMVVLFAGLTQFFAVFRLKYPRVHRWVGRVYCFNIVFIVAPAGFVMALYANGGLLGRAAFVTLAVLWWGTTWLGYRAARHKRFEQHRRWMIYSFALTLSAVTFRLCLMTMRQYVHMPPIEMYGVASWLGFVPNLLVAYGFLRWGHKKTHNG